MHQAEQQSMDRAVAALGNVSAAPSERQTEDIVLTLTTVSIISSIELGQTLCTNMMYSVLCCVVVWSRYC